MNNVLSQIKDYINKEFKEYTINFKKIWNEQKIYDSLEKQLVILTKEVFNFITRDDRITLNVTEWCKKEICWQRAQKEKWTITKEFLLTLILKENEKEEIIIESKKRKVENKINLEIEVIKLGAKYWENILRWGSEKNIFTLIEKSVLKVASNFDKTGKTPSSKQCNLLFKIRDKVLDEGYNE